MLRLISRFIFWIQGWKIDDDLLKQQHLDKFILTGAPHTSNWDALMFVAAMYHMKLKVRFLIKHDWMRFPFNLMFGPLGAIGIDRSKHHSMVDAMVKLFNESEKLIITIAPEGTRSYNPHWKKGFYYTALEAKIPILLGHLDYENRIAGITKVFWPTGDVDKDLTEISNFYSQFKGKNPEKFAPYQPTIK